ncbi:MAG: glutamate 5-kinase [Chthoniobacterales bacterium]
MKRVVVKLGSGVLSKNDGLALDAEPFDHLARDLAKLRKNGIECIVVSSGAIAAGAGLLGLKTRPTDTASKQASAAAGQPVLMQFFEKSLHQQNLHVAQLLLSHGDIDSTMRRKNAQNTLERLLSAGNIIPIINENDSVAVEELRFGDNDRLSAEVAAMASADLLIILTSVDGFFMEGKLATEIRNLELAGPHVTGDTGKFSVGGMKTKLEAVRIAWDAGIPVALANGRTPGVLADLVEENNDRPVGTCFPLPNTKAD